MSEDFLSRWSRRKRDAAQPTPPTQADEPERVVEPEAPATTAEQAADTSSKVAELPFDLASLPPIESITAATDIRPFLAPGVPAEIACAALRRAWTADPTIRNFVGLADYDWDYHKPGSMAGFGPLEMTDELRQVVARIVGAAPAEAAMASPDDSWAEAQPSETPSVIRAEQPSVIAAPASNCQVTPATNELNQDVVSGSERSAVVGHKHSAVQQDAPEHEVSPSIVRRTHGGALPK
jgi:hypothetical protein